MVRVEIQKSALVTTGSLSSVSLASVWRLNNFFAVLVVTPKHFIDNYVCHIRTAIYRFKTTSLRI